ncbi:MAG: autotransporter-associated beta strand repeat-containing protein [Verrucomicrobiaceae bacterium]|nr:autotransporter-associated beta strand repeat-containing protein [Verrucomicrobiaceae bacterium]
MFVSPSGSDASDGSLATPYLTIQKALSVAMPGDSVKLRAGTYREIVNAARSGTAGSPIVIENYNGEQAVISALDMVSGAWTAQGGGIFETTVAGARPATFWTTPGVSPNGTSITDAAGSLRMTVVNEAANQSASIRSSASSAAWDFFSKAVTWKVRGLSATSSGTTVMPGANMNLYLSIMGAANNGFASEDAVNVQYRGDGRLALNLKKNTVNSWGTTAHVTTDATVNGYDLTMGPASGGAVPYTFTVKRAVGGDVVFSGSWTISQSEWTDGGTGSTSYFGLFAQEGVTTTDVTQKFTIGIDSYTVSSGATTLLRDEFDDGDVPTVTEFPASLTSSLSSGYDQVFVDGVMQDEARLPNKGAGTLMAPTTASVTVTNASAGTNPNTISSTAFGGKATNFFAGARFVGGIGVKWSWQNAVIASSAGNLLTVDPATKSTWWWPDYTGTSNSSDTGTGFVYGLLSLLDADGEWFLDQPTSTLSLRITGGADPTSHVVEIKRRNWCVSVNGSDYITVRGLKTIGGAIRLNGTGNVLENCEAVHLSHFMVWTNGSSSSGGRAEGGGVVVSGTGNVVRGCTIHDTAGSGIQTSGTGHLLTRNTLYNIDYSGTYAAPLALAGEDMTATFNTIHDSGRDGVKPTGGGLTLMFNDVSYAGRLAHDLGCIYTFGADAYALSGRRSRIAYNWVHDRGDTTDSLSKGIYLDNGCRNFVVDHNVAWGLGSSSTDGALRMNSPNFGHVLYHNTVIGAGTYNDGTYTSYPDVTTFGGYTFTDATHGMDIVGWNNLKVPDAGTGAAFENFAAQDFTPKAAASYADKRYVSAIAVVNPPASGGNVEWIKAAGDTNTSNSLISVLMSSPTSPYFYREAYGHGQGVAGINAWVPDGKPDSGAYERGVSRWVPGVSGWEGIKADTPLGIGARTAMLQGVRVSVDTASATNVRVYYGTTDGGTNAAAWSNVLDLGTAAPGDVISVFRPALADLTPGTTYQARFFASNASGDAWSDVQTFTTAASLTWDAGGGASTGISTNTNWQSDPLPDLAHGGEIATFGSAGSTAVIDASVSLLGIVINRDANFAIADGAGSITLGSAGITVTLPTTTARTHTISENTLTLATDQTWPVTNNTGAANLNISSSIGDGAGAFGFTKTGSGTVTLSGSSDFDGAVNVNVGVLAITHSNSLGSSTGTTTIAATGSTTTGGQLKFSGDITTAENIIITGTTEAGSFLRAIDSTSGTNTLNGSITLVGTGQVRLGPATGTLQINGSITRSGTDVGPLMLAPATGATVIIAQPIDTNGSQFNVTGGGTVVLNASSTDLGGTTIFFGASSPNGPVLKLGVNDALPTTRNVTLGTNSTTNGADKGTLDLAGFNQTINALIGTQGTGTTPSAASTRRVTNSVAATTSTLTVGNGNASSTFNGLIEDGAGKVALTKVGTGTLTLPTANTYTGDTTVTGGSLSLSTASLAATSAVNLSTGTFLNLNFAGTNNITTLRINDLAQAPGTWGSLTSSATNKTALVTGTGLLNITAPQPAYDAWALASGLDNSTTAKDASITADSDHDGVSNLMEYATKMNGNASDTVPQSATKNGSVIDFIYTKNKAATDVTFIVEWSDTLGNDWSTAGVSAPTILSDNGVTQQIKVTVPAGTGVAKRFVHLKATRP